MLRRRRGAGLEYQQAGKASHIGQKGGCRLELCSRAALSSHRTDDDRANKQAFVRPLGRFQHWQDHGQGKESSQKPLTSGSEPPEESFVRQIRFTDYSATNGDDRREGFGPAPYARLGQKSAVRALIAHQSESRKRMSALATCSPGSQWQCRPPEATFGDHRFT